MITKTNRVLGLFLLAFLAIAFRVWHLAVVQREEKLLESQKPQQRTILVRADRGTICDRFHIPLALNRICYNAAIYYSQLTQIPTIIWKSDGQGKQVKTYARKEYIRKLSEILAKTLQLDEGRVEDLIHSKAALFPHVPFIIKSSLTEEEHYRLKMIEKDWPGVHAEIASSRYYPQGKNGCGLIGTMGAISQKEYTAIAQETAKLQGSDDPFDQERLLELKEKAYAIHDLIGKTGIEAEFEEDLRGLFGKKIFEVDQKGRFLREIVSKEAIPGQQVVLSISSELQQFAEGLLAQDEAIRDDRSYGFDPVDKTKKIQKQPWMKGGAIVALDPKTGEVLALASYPRFDPNDFISSKKSVERWLENESFIASVWDGHESLIRERGRNFKEEEQALNWEFFLDSILPKEGPIRNFLSRVDDVKGAIQWQEDYEAFLYFSRLNLPVPNDLQKRLDSVNLSPQDKIFAIDLFRTVVYAPAFTDELIAKMGGMKISVYWSMAQAFQRHEKQIKQRAEKSFHHNEFRSWREANQKEFLAAMRKKEKESKTYARPYIEYLDKKEKELFASHWEETRLAKLTTSEFSEDLIRTFRSFSQLNRPLLGKYKTVRNAKKEQTEKDLAASFYPRTGFGLSRSFAFESSSPQGSIFKLVTAYEGLRQGKQLTLIDEHTKEVVAYNLNRVPYPRFYKGGRLPRSASSQVGKIDLLGAIERTSNPYFSILAGDYFQDPEDLANAARLLGFGEKTGIEIPRESRGNVPNDLKTNRTGLYSTAIGQHTLLTTPLQTAVMLTTLANGGNVVKPRLVKHATEIKRTIPLDQKILNQLYEGMDRVIWGAQGSARPTIIKGLLRNPILMRDYLALHHQMIGKTGTAEIACNFSANPTNPAQLYKYIWFGSIAFQDTKHEDPELVVVVLLRFGDAGKEAAPLAAQMIHKWREIKKKHER